MPPRPAKRLLIIGWDAADWKIIDAQFGSGGMPVLRGLIERGVRADLATLEPRLSPILWTSIATGKTADKHGILNFVEPDPAGAGLRLSASTSRKTKALWNIFSQSGLRTHVVNWYASHPAEPIRGVVVANTFQDSRPADPDLPWPLPTGAIFPPALEATVAPLRMHPRELAAEEMLEFVPRLREVDPRHPGIPFLAGCLAQCASVHNVATTLLAEDNAWDCAMVFYDTIDTAAHHFMQYYPPRMDHVPPREFEIFRQVMPSLYHLHDLMLGRLLDLAGPETTVILLSDHGFQSDHLRPRPAPREPGRPYEHTVMGPDWHRGLGILAMSGPGVKRGEAVYGANLLDIAPTALTLLGVPVGADMDGRVLVEALERAPIERVFSWDALEGDAGQHPPDLRIDAVEARQAMEQLVALGYLREIPEDDRARAALLSRETRFNLAVVYMTTGRIAQALPLLGAIHAEDPDESRFAVNLAQCYHNMGRFAEARAVLADLLRRKPGAAFAKAHLGAALFAEGRLDEAGALLEEAERENPGNPDLTCMRGTIYVFLSRWDDAERLFRKAVSFDPHNARAYHGLALTALGRERFEEAAGHCLRAVEILHFYPDAHYTLGVALTWMKDYEHAIRSFRVALSMRPGMIDAHRYIASIYRHLDDRRSARPHRDAAERLLSARAQGGVAPEALVRGAPLGPQEWARHMNVTDQEPG
jgi:tetratricopeptide (TPR) repeat protein